MELDQFLETDIQEFLDNELEKKTNAKNPRAEQAGLFQSTTDYRAETDKALERGDVHRARILFEQTKREYDASTGTAKEEYAQLIKDLQAKAAAHYTHLQATQNLFKELEDLTEGKGRDIPVNFFTATTVTSQDMEQTSRAAMRNPVRVITQPVYTQQTTPTPSPTIITQTQVSPQQISQTGSTTIRSPTINIVKDNTEIEKLRRVTREQEERIHALETRRTPTQPTYETNQSRRIQTQTPQRITIPEITRQATKKYTRPKIIEYIEKMQSNMEQGRPRAAMQAYQNAKQEYAKLPPEKKKEYRKTLSDAYQHINQTISRKKEPERHTTNQETPIEISSPPKPEMPAPKKTEQTTEKTRQVHDLIENIRRSVDRGDVQTAEQGFLELHQTLAGVQNKAIQDILSRIKHEISVLKHVKNREIGTDESTMYMKGVFYLVSGNKEKAAEEFRKVIERNPNHFAARARLSQALAITQ